MFKKTSLYGVAAIALSFATPVSVAFSGAAWAQTASYTATTAPANAAKSAAAPSAAAPSSSPSTSGTSSTPGVQTNAGGVVDFNASSDTPSALEDMAADSIAETDQMIGTLAGDDSGETIRDNSGDTEIRKPKTDDSKPRWYDDNGNPFSDKYFEAEPGAVLLALQRDPQLPPGHFVLYMSATKSLVSCVKILNPKFATEFNANGTMTITMEKYTVDARDMPRYPHYQCNTTPQQPGVYVNLSKELLQENNVKKIKFKVAKTSETYLVKVTDNYIQLTPETRRAPQDLANRFRPLEVNGVNTTMKLWFYPENTVILTADGTDKDITLESRLMELARAKGLTPLTDVMPEHATFRKPAGQYYFVDQSGRYRVGNGELFDYIQADIMKFGLEADEPAKKNVAVFIRKPGQYD